MKKLVYIWVLVLASLSCNVFSQDKIDEVIIDFKDYNEEAYFRKLEKIPKNPLNEFEKNLPKRENHKLINWKDRKGNQHPRVFNFAVKFKNYWIFSYYLQYGIVNVSRVCILKLDEDERMELIVFLPFVVSRNDLNNFSGLIDKNRNRLKLENGNKYILKEDECSNEIDVCY